MEAFVSWKILVSFWFSIFFIHDSKNPQMYCIHPNNLLHFSIRASSPDSKIVTNWVQIEVNDVDSKKHVRADFKLSDKIDVITGTECDKISQVLSHNENEESNTIDTGGEGEQVLAYNRATHNNLFFLSFLISIILTVSSV